MAQPMTMQEMRAQFDGEWILVEDPETNEALEVLAGNVAHHSKDRDEVYREAIARHPKCCAIVYTGELLPEGTAIVL